MRSLRIHRPPGFTGLMIPRPERKVVVGYPAGGSVSTVFHVSMLRLQAHEIAKGDECLLSRMMHCVSLYVGQNRQTLTERFLQGDGNWLLQVDADIEFPANVLELLVERTRGGTRKVVAANVPLGTYPSSGFHQTGPLEWESPWEPFGGDPADDAAVEVDAVATAVLLVHREVFETIADRHGQCWFNHMYCENPAPDGTPSRLRTFREIAEDMAFSIRAKEAGFSIWLTRVPGLRHHKTGALSEDFRRPVAPGESPDSALGRRVVEV